MKIRNVYAIEVSEEEKEVLNKAIEILDHECLNNIKCNGGSRLTDRIYAAIQLLKDINEGKLF